MSSATQTKRRGGLGRKKILIEKIKNPAYRQATFSKRRAGLFKKASDLCILCGAEMAILVFSSSGKVFTFGHPCADSVVDRYLGQQHDDGSTKNIGVHEQQWQQYTAVLKQFDAEKKRAGENLKITNSTTVTASDHLLRRLFSGDLGPMEDLELEELENLKTALEGLKNKVEARLDEIGMSKNCLPLTYYMDDGTCMGTTTQSSSTATPSPPPPLCGADSTMPFLPSTYYMHDDGSMETTTQSSSNATPPPPPPLCGYSTMPFLPSTYYMHDDGSMETTTQSSSTATPPPPPPPPLCDGYSTMPFLPSTYYMHDDGSMETTTQSSSTATPSPPPPLCGGYSTMPFLPLTYYMHDDGSMGTTTQAQRHHHHQCVEDV